MFMLVPLLCIIFVAMYKYAKFLLVPVLVISFHAVIFCDTCFVANTVADSHLQYILMCVHFIKGFSDYSTNELSLLRIVYGLSRVSVRDKSCSLFLCGHIFTTYSHKNHLLLDVLTYYAIKPKYNKK